MLLQKIQIKSHNVIPYNANNTVRVPFFSPTCLLFIIFPVPFLPFHILDEVCCNSAPSCAIHLYETTMIINYADYRFVIW